MNPISEFMFLDFTLSHTLILREIEPVKLIVLYNTNQGPNFCEHILKDE